MAELPILDELHDALYAAAMREDERAPEKPPSVARVRVPRRTVLIALGLLLLLAASATATVLVLRAAVITAPPAADVPLEQTPIPGSARVAQARADDPDGGPPWALRVVRSRTGLACVTVGQLDGEAFGLIGLDRRFRRLPLALVDSCGQLSAGAPPLAGARLLASPRREDARSVIYAYGRPGLVEAVVESADGARRVAPAADGSVVTVLRGYPEDSAARLVLRFADREQRLDLGTQPGVSVDTAGGAAWTTERTRIGSHAVCAWFYQARPRLNGPRGPATCAGRTRLGFAAARRFAPGDGGSDGPLAWAWRDFPARTVVWGGFVRPGAVRSAMLLGAGSPRPLSLARGGTFVAVLPASVEPARLTVVATEDDGRLTRIAVDDGPSAPPRPPVAERRQERPR